MADLEKEVLIKKTAAAVAAGASAMDIAKELKVTVQKVRYLMGLSETKAQVDKLLDVALGDVVKTAKKQIANLMPKTLKALEANLDDGQLKAVEIVLKATGVMNENENQEQNTAITVVMPGGEKQEYIDITPKDTN